ncbi:hypothetical protein P3T36_006914 [Kitasatospora sp. MAP12-15]|nr:hypothetical protein [Kitasatospora sp. MAP12-44]
MSAAVASIPPGEVPGPTSHSRRQPASHAYYDQRTEHLVGTVLHVPNQTRAARRSQVLTQFNEGRRRIAARRAQELL